MRSRARPRQVRTKRLPLFAVAAALAIASWARPAHAFCRAKACDETLQPDPACGRDNFGCQPEGPILYWSQRCLSFTVQKSGSPLHGISYDSAHEVALKAFYAWLGADCGGGATPSFAIRDFGAAECGVPEYNKIDPNANVIMFRDDAWDKEQDLFNTLALTTLSYNTETNEIYDADIEINSNQMVFVVSDDIQEGEFDLQAVVTHEVGHFLGLSHSALNQATMWAIYTGGVSQLRDLHDDDIAGICEIFPPGNPVDTNHCAPRHGFSPKCQDDVAEEGCAIGTPGRAGTSAGLLSALVFFGLLRRRRR